MLAPHAAIITTMHSYLVALRISGQTLDVAEVTAKLRLKPTQTRVAGQQRPGGKSRWNESMWEYEVLPSNKKSKSEWSSLEEGLAEILLTFRTHKRMLRQFQRRFKVCLFCGHFSSSFDGGPTLSPSLLRQLGDFGVELFLDTYFSDDSSASD